MYPPKTQWYLIPLPIFTKNKIETNDNQSRIGAASIEQQLYSG